MEGNGILVRQGIFLLPTGIQGGILCIDVIRGDLIAACDTVKPATKMPG